MQEQRTDWLKHHIEHCISVIALCRAGGQVKAEASYEEQLERLQAELEELRLKEVMELSIEHKEREGMEP